MLPVNSVFVTYCSIIAGLLLALAFAPFNYAVLAIFSLSYLFWSWQGVSAAKAALRGYLFGCGLFGVGVSWVYVSVHDFGGASMLGAGLLTVFFVAFWALFPALIGFCVVKFNQIGNHWVSLLLAPLVWILVENIRGYWLLNGFPWLQIAYTQLDTPLSGYIPLLGVYGTGFLLALNSAVLVFCTRQQKYRIRLLSLLGGIWLGGWALSQIQWTEEVGDAFKVSLVQGNISQDQKWVPQNRMNTLMKYKQLTQQHWDSKVIIWPEASIPAFLSDVDEFYIRPLEAEAKQHQVDLVVSLPMDEPDSKAMFNGVLVIGKERGAYKKNHLLPFGEYMPLQPLSGFVLKLLGIKLGDFNAGGDQQAFLKAGGYAFSTSICYEDAFGGEVARNIEQAAFLVNVTNDAWFGNSIEPHQHMQIARMRALETGRFLARATNTGITGFVGPNGKIISQAPLFETYVLTDAIKPMQGLTPYARIGDYWIIGGLSLLLIIVVVVIKRSKQLSPSAIT